MSTVARQRSVRSGDADGDIELSVTGTSALPRPLSNGSGGQKAGSKKPKPKHKKGVQHNAALVKHDLVDAALN